MGWAILVYDGYSEIVCVNWKLLKYVNTINTINFTNIKTFGSINANYL